MRRRRERLSIARAGLAERKPNSQVKDALACGASILTEETLRRPTFIVFIPGQKVRVETLEPDLA